MAQLFDGLSQGGRKWTNYLINKYSDKGLFGIFHPREGKVVPSQDDSKFEKNQTDLFSRKSLTTFGVLK